MKLKTVIIDAFLDGLEGFSYPCYEVPCCVCLFMFIFLKVL